MSTRAGELPRAATRARASAARYLPAALRLLLLLLLGAALLLDRPAAPTAARAAVLWLPAEGAAPGTPLYDSLLVGTPPVLLVRPAAAPPSATELEALAAASARTPLLAALPAAPAALRVWPPPRPRVGRAAAIPVALLAEPGQRVQLRLSDESGPVDSLTLTADDNGEIAGAFRVRPSRAGWQEWSVAHGSQRRWTGAWVTEAEPPRVLVVAGPPTWESRFIVRALEESGARVELVQPLGRGLELPAELPALPATAAALQRFDAVLLLEGASTTPAQSRALEAYAARGGGGVLQVGAPGAAAGQGGEADASRIRWSLPAELAPLPETELRSATLPIGALPPAAVAGAYGAGGEPLLVLQSAGRGRLASLALTESWRWRMEAGRVAEHREFWRSLVDWLSGGVREAQVVQVTEAIVPPGTPVEVRVYASDTPPALTLTRPEGATETLPLTPDPERAGVLRALFLPATEGLFTLALGEQPVSAALRAAEDAAVPSYPWAQLALLAHASGGAMLDPDSLAPEVRRRTGALPAPADPPRRREPLLFALILALAASEWTIRRLTGRK